MAYGKPTIDFSVVSVSLVSVPAPVEGVVAVEAVLGVDRVRPALAL